MLRGSQRILWVDIAKGILITLVVAGHSANIGHPSIGYKQIFWFHMPAFFVLSGYLFRPVTNWNDFFKWLKKRSLTLLIPYSSFLILDTAYNYVTHDYISVFGKNLDINNIFWLLFGGRFISDVYWFVTCLLVTQILFHLLFLLVKTNKIRVLLIITSYILAHFEATIAATIGWWKIFVPWNMDVALLTLTYFAFGYYGKKLIRNSQVSTWSILFSFLIIVIYKMRLFDYSLDLKTLGYRNVVLDFFIPLTFTMSVMSISSWLALWLYPRLKTYLPI